MMKAIIKITMLLALVGVLASCGSLRTASDYDKNIDFSPYKTYNFYDKGLSRVRLNDLDKRRMLIAIDQEMTAKGFVKSENPDMLVNLVIVSQVGTDVYNYGPRFYGFGWGWGYPFMGGGMTSVQHYNDGTIIIDFLDPKRKEVIWHGRGAGFNLDNFKNRDLRVQKGVSEILSQYPPKN